MEMNFKNERNLNKKYWSFYALQSCNAVKKESKSSQNSVKMQPKCSQNSVKNQSKCSQNAAKMQSKNLGVQSTKGSGGPSGASEGAIFN